MPTVLGGHLTIRGVLGLWVLSGIRLLGTLRSEDSDGTEKVAWKLNSPSFNLHRDFSNSLNQMWAKVDSPGVEFPGTISNLRKRKTISTLLVYVLHKRWNQAFSRLIRTVTATKCTKKGLLHVQTYYKTIPFSEVKFSLPSPSSYLNVPITFHDILT